MMKKTFNSSQNPSITFKKLYLSILQGRQLFVCCLSLGLLIGMNGCTGPGSGEEWPGITVKVNSDYAVETSKTLTKEKGSFQRLDITISNPGTNIVTIENIEIHVPLPGSLSGEMKVAHGSSCMGTRPLLIHPVNDKQSQDQPVQKIEG